MYRIGEFSRLGSVTIETLRHYDALGLLKPAQVDSFTGYRYYTAQQLQSLNRIIALKEVGFSLEEIAHILRDNPTTEELRGMLKAQLALTESVIEAAQLRRERIQTRLTYLNLEDNMPAYEVTLKPVSTYTVAAIRETIPQIEQVSQRIGEMFQSIAAWMAENKLPFGLPLTLYHNKSYTQENVDTECAIIIGSTEVGKIAPPPHPIQVRQTEPYANVATSIVTGRNSEHFKLAYNTIGQWICDHGYHIVGAPRELYYNLPDSEEFTAEIQFPVARGER